MVKSRNWYHSSHSYRQSKHILKSEFEARGFEADAENWVLDSFVEERILLPIRLRSANAYVWSYVMICVEANFPPASARVRSAHVWTYINRNEIEFRL